MITMITNQPDHDTLSELPLGIIHMILARVPIRDAVRTGILSRRWRYTWASLPHLVFKDECASSDSKIIRKFEKRVENSVNRALFHHKGPIHLFKLSIQFLMRSPDIDEWIHYLSRNDIKEFVLHMGEFGHHDPVRVHSSIYSCEKLTKLDLWNCELDPPPLTFKGFLFLRCLLLQFVCISSNEIESLVAHIPLLERLELIGLIEQSSELTISSRNLKYFKISGNYIELCVSTPRLAEFSIDLCDIDFIEEHQQQNSSVCNYANFMGGFTNLEKLQGCMYFTKYLSMGIESCQRTLLFHQLKDIALSYVHFGNKKQISVVARLIVGSPNLQKLSIQTDWGTPVHPVLEAPHLSSRDFGFAPNCTFKKLKIVDMRSFYGDHPFVTDFLKFLLLNSPVLETMHVFVRRFALRPVTEEVKQNVRAELLVFAGASPDAKLSLDFN